MKKIINIFMFFIILFFVFAIIRYYLSNTANNLKNPNRTNIDEILKDKIVE